MQSIDTVVDVCYTGPASSGSDREETVEIPQLQPVSWTLSFTRPCVQRQMPMVDVLMQFIDISHVPVIMQRRCTGEVPLIPFSLATVDIPVVQQRKGTRLSALLFGGDDAFCVIFRAPLAALESSKNWRPLTPPPAPIKLHVPNVKVRLVLGLLILLEHHGDVVSSRRPWARVRRQFRPKSAQVASRPRLASGFAGGWPRQMGHRLAIQYGGPRGSSAEGHGDLEPSGTSSWPCGLCTWWCSSCCCT